METVEVGLGEFGAAVHVVDAFTSVQSHTHTHTHTTTQPRTVREETKI
jgi:hypothetical protein